MNIVGSQCSLGVVLWAQRDVWQNCSCLPVSLQPWNKYLQQGKTFSPLGKGSKRVLYTSGLAAVTIRKRERKDQKRLFRFPELQLITTFCLLRFCWVIHCKELRDFFKCLSWFSPALWTPPSVWQSIFAVTQATLWFPLGLIICLSQARGQAGWWTNWEQCYGEGLGCLGGG